MDIELDLMKRIKNMFNTGVATMLLAIGIYFLSVSGNFDNEPASEFLADVIHEVAEVVREDEKKEKKMGKKVKRA